MLEIKIAPELKEKCPQLRLGCISSEIKYEKKPIALWNLIEEHCNKVQASQDTKSIKELSTLFAAREAYKVLGKEPSRYRLSAEALLRRVIQGKGLYNICNLVDLLNLVSIQTGFSIGGYDLEKIQGEISFSIGGKEPYQAIGRGAFNIENLPVFFDDLGPFGSPTSDSERTMVREETKTFLMILIDFGNDSTLDKAMELSIQYLKQFAKAESIKSFVIT